MRIRRRFTNLSTIRWKGAVDVLSTEAYMRKRVQNIVDYGETVVGFDVEYTSKNTPALVQIATATKTFLCRICKLSKEPLNPLLPLLSNANILKVGVGIDQDVKHLQDLQHFDAAGFVDINTIARDPERTNGNTLSLQDLSAKFLPGYITKEKDSSDWVAKDLTDSQITYAAMDAWAGREIYVRAARHMKLRQIVVGWLQVPAARPRMYPAKLSVYPKTQPRLAIPWASNCLWHLLSRYPISQKTSGLQRLECWSHWCFKEPSWQSSVVQ